MNPHKVVTSDAVTVIDHTEDRRQTLLRVW